MKICPKCKKEYDDSWSVCLNCGVNLSAGVESRLAQLEKQAKMILEEISAIRKGEVFAAGSGETEKSEELSQNKEKPPKEDTEIRIGKYLLNRIGIISVVAGVAFFLSYAFRYLSPVWRIFIGYAVSALMIAGGNAADKIKKYKWYGRGILAGGWVLAYFTTYAMYHVNATRVISSQAVDLMLTAAVVGFMTAHLLRYKSQSLVMLAMLLGYITAGITPYASFSFLYLGILALVSGFLLIKMNWHGAAMFSLLGTYATHLIWVRNYSLLKPGTLGFWVSLGALAGYWMIFNASGFFIKAENKKHRAGVDAFVVVNSVLFGILLFLSVRAYSAAGRAAFALAAAAVLAGIAAAAKYVKGKGQGQTAYTIAAIGFITASFRYLAGKEYAYLIWFCEIPILLWAGIYLKNVLYRGAAWALFGLTSLFMAAYFGIPEANIIILGKEMYITLFLYLAGISCFYLSRQIYGIMSPGTKAETTEINLSAFYAAAATIVLLGVSFYEIQTKLVTLTWAVSALLLFITGFFTRDRIFRYSGIALVAASILRILTVDLAGVNTVSRITVFICLGFVLLAVSFWYTKMPVLGHLREGSIRKGLRLAAAGLIPIVSIWVLAAAYLYPSEFRKEEKLREKEIEITARFISGEKLSGEEIVFLRQRKFNALEETLRSLNLGKDGDNLGIYLRSLEAGLVSLQVYDKLGWYYGEQGQYEKAIGLYEKGIAIDPEFKQWTTRYVLRNTAKLYKKTEKYAKAAEKYEQYLALYKNTEDLYELAVCYERLGELDKALEKLNEAMKLNQGSQYSGEINSLRSDIYSKKDILEEKEPISSP